MRFAPHVLCADRADALLGGVYGSSSEHEDGALIVIVTRIVRADDVSYGVVVELKDDLKEEVFG